jgi:4-hydroxybenzoyl-CoA thioesterase
MSGAPYVYRRQIHWGDTDAGGIVYTGQFLYFMIEAIESWWRDVVGVDYWVMIRDHDIASPTVHISLDFVAPVRGGDVLNLSVLVERLGRSSISFIVEGKGNDGVARFNGKLVSAICDTTPFGSTDVPAEWRQSIEAYQKECG